MSAGFERPCPVCIDRSYVLFAEENIDQKKLGPLTYASRKPPEYMCLRLVRCTTCDLIYAPSPPTNLFLEAAYGDADFDSDQEAIDAAKTYAKALEPHLKALTSRKIAVDIGAGSGPLLHWFKELGFRTVIGIEPSKAAIQSASPSVRHMLREGMFSKSIVEGETPSLICSFMTLEHLSDPGEFASIAQDILEAGGALAIVVHNWRAPINRFFGLRSPIIDVEHLQLFSPRSLHWLLRKYGFEHISVQSVRNSYQLRYWVLLTPLPDSVKRILLFFLKLLKLDNHYFSINVGNMLAVGFKPKPP
jgi:SAM-dependent methyltransferase